MAKFAKARGEKAGDQPGAPKGPTQGSHQEHFSPRPRVLGLVNTLRACPVGVPSPAPSQVPGPEGKPMFHTSHTVCTNRLGTGSPLNQRRWDTRPPKSKFPGASRAILGRPSFLRGGSACGQLPCRLCHQFVLVVLRTLEKEEVKTVI